jgi:hypothetical protein
MGSHIATNEFIIVAINQYNAQRFIVKGRHTGRDEGDAL